MKTLGIYPYATECSSADFRPSLKELLKSLYKRQSQALNLLDNAKAEKLAGTHENDNWDYLGEESVKRLKILDLWL